MPKKKTLQQVEPLQRYGLRRWAALMHPDNKNGVQVDPDKKVKSKRSISKTDPWR